MSENRILRVATMEKSRSSLESKEERRRKSEQRKQMKEKMEEEMRLIEQQRKLLMEDRNRETIQQSNEMLNESEEGEYEVERVEEEESVEKEKFGYTKYLSQEQKQKERNKLCSDGDIDASMKSNERQRRRFLSESGVTRMNKVPGIGSFEKYQGDEIEETDSVLVDTSENVNKGYVVGDRFSYEQDLKREEMERKRDIMMKIRNKETREKEKITSENILEQLGLLDEDIENSIEEGIKKCEEDTEKAKRHLSSIKLKKERKLLERQTQDERECANPKLQKHVTFPDTPDTIKKVMKERYSDINETGTRRKLYQDELSANEERENRSEERNEENKRPLYREPAYSPEYREAMQKMKSRSRELDEIKKGQELELRKMLEQKRQFEIQRQKKLEEEAELQDSIEELELKEKEIELNQLKASKLKMEMEAIRTDDECMKKNLKILRLRRSALIERIQLKNTPPDTETEEKVKKSEPKIESGVSKQDHVFVGKPFVPAFDGKNFEDWKIEVECLVKSKMYPEPLLTQGIRASLKRNTRRSLQSLNPSATIAELLEKLEEVYGSLKESDALMQDFYSSKQNPSESASDWGVRVENIFQKMVRKGEKDTSQRNTMLKRKFWRGLYVEKLREAMRVSRESADTFEILRKKTRKEEKEMYSDSKFVSQHETEHSSTVHQPIRTIQNTKESKLDTVLIRMEALEKEIQELRSRDKSQGFRDRGGFFRGRPRFRGGRGEYRGRGRDGRDDSQRRESKREPLEEKVDTKKQEMSNTEKSEKKEQLNE